LPGGCGLRKPGGWAQPAEQAQAFLKEGYRYQKAERYQEAIYFYEQSLGQNPKQAKALDHLGFCCMRLRQYRRAIAYFQDALEISPSLAEVHEHLGEAYLAVGWPKLARREYALLLPLDPKAAKELKKKLDRSEEARAYTQPDE